MMDNADGRMLETGLNRGNSRACLPKTVPGRCKQRGGPLSTELDWNGLMDPMKYIGRSVEQTERFIKEVVDPLREQYKDDIAKLHEELNLLRARLATLEAERAEKAADQV